MTDLQTTVLSAPKSVSVSAVNSEEAGMMMMSQICVTCQRLEHESCLWLCSHLYTLLGWQRTKIPIKNESYLHTGSVSSNDQHITDRIDLPNGCGLICCFHFSVILGINSKVNACHADSGLLKSICFIFLILFCVHVCPHLFHMFMCKMFTSLYI